MKIFSKQIFIGTFAILLSQISLTAYAKDINVTVYDNKVYEYTSFVKNNIVLHSKNTQSSSPYEFTLSSSNIINKKTLLRLYKTDTNSIVNLLINKSLQAGKNCDIENIETSVNNIIFVIDDNGSLNIECKK